MANQVQRIAAPDSDRVQQRPRQRHPSIQRSVVCPVTSVPETGSAYLTSPPMATGARSPASANAAGSDQDHFRLVCLVHHDGDDHNRQDANAEGPGPSLPACRADHAANPMPARPPAR